jgi:hypothetical protein
MDDELYEKGIAIRERCSARTGRPGEASRPRDFEGW